MVNKKAQLGQTLTWTVGTIVILVVLFIFIFVSGILGAAKIVGDGIFAGTDNYVTVEESYLANQEMLHASIKYDNFEAKKALFREEEGEAEKAINVFLNLLETRGLNCNFRFVPMDYHRTLRFNPSTTLTQPIPLLGKDNFEHLIRFNQGSIGIKDNWLELICKK